MNLSTKKFHVKNPEQLTNVKIYKDIENHADFFGMHYDFIKELIDTKNVEKIKRYLNKGDWSEWETFELIKGIGSLKSPKEYTEYLDKIFHDETINLSSTSKAKLIISLKEYSEMSEARYINNLRRWIKDDTLKFTSIDKKNLILSLKDLQFMQRPISEESKEQNQIDGINVYELNVLEYMRMNKTIRFEFYG